MWGIIISIGLTLALQFLQPKPKAPKAAGLNEFNIPTAEVGRDIPVLFGTKEITGPNVVWYGDFKKKAIKKSSGGLFGQTYTAGYKYYIGMHMVLCHGIAKLLGVKIGGKSAWTGETTGGQIHVNAYDKGKGYVDFLSGVYTQGQNGYLERKLGNDVPAFRGIASAVLRQVYVGKSPYIEPWKFYVQRIPTDWLQEKAKIGDFDMNPVHVIREVLTNPVWGLGLSVAEIDDANFTAAASALYAENFGISLCWDRSTSAEDFIDEIKKYINAGTYIDPVTGKIKIILIRNDYDVGTLPIFNETNIAKIEDYKHKAGDELINTITVKFWDRSTRKEHGYTAIDEGLRATMGGTNAQENDYIGITSRNLANKIAARDLATLSKPLTSAIITTNRDGAALSYGAPFKLVWERYGITSMIMRVAAIEYLDITKNSVRIECLQDVFGFDESHFTSPPPSLWVDPIGDPSPVLLHSFIEAPYYHLARESGQPAADALGANGHLAITGVNPGNGAYEAELWVKDNTAYFNAGDADFCPTCILNSDVGIVETVFNVKNWDDMDSVALNTWAIIGSEIIRIDSISEDGNAITVGRGCLDTVPVAHFANERIYFAQDAYESTVAEYASGKTVYAKLLTITPYGKLAIGDATEVSLEFSSRAIRPYPPARLRINNLAEPEVIENADLVIDWHHRNRKTQVTEQILDTEDDSVSPEDGTSYTAELKKAADDTQLVLKTGITENTVTISAAEVGYDGDVYLLLWSVRDVYTSFQMQRRDFYYSATEMRITEDGEFRVTEGNDFRRLEA